MQLEQYDDLIKFYTHAISLDPNNPSHHNNISLIYSTKEIDKALDFGSKALSLDPKSPTLLSNQALNYKRNDDTDLAISLLEEALKYEYSPEILTNLGATYADKNDIKNSLKCLKKALKINPEFTGARVNLPYCYHMLDDHRRGWKNYEYRLKHFEQLIQYLNILGNKKLWNGKKDLTNKHVIIFAEQGYGDLIQFSRFFNFLKTEHNCKKITVMCGKKIAPLARLFLGVDDVILKEDYKNLPEYDYHLPMMSLPWLLKKYEPLWVEGVLKFDKKIHLSNKFKIGIAWKGSPTHPQDRKRSCDIKYFLKLKQPDIQLVNLTTEKLNDPDILDIIEPQDDFLKTAEIINSVDQVTSVDTSVLHLAGMLKKSVVGLLPFRPDFRWGLDKEKTDWYPNMRLLRQKKAGDWNSVFERFINY